MNPYNIQNLIERLEEGGILKSVVIKKALTAVDRIKFVPNNLSESAYLDKPLPLADRQTISQPTTVVFMLELLDVRQGQNVLDIGAGSGWVSCLLSYLAGIEGRVTAYEINNKVGELGKKNTKECKVGNLKYIIDDATKRWIKNAPYDRIHSGAAFTDVPKDLMKLLKLSGILVAPTQDGYVKKITRIGENDFKKEEHFGFTFVPFITPDI